jgi:hypothetical protein
MKKDGSFGVGYFGAEDVSRGNETDWAQLVAGVVWLVRNGRHYVSQSSMLEDLSIQETGGSFVTVTSARNSIGHDARGRLMLVLVNGKTYQRGVNLPLFAHLLVSLGAVNAINLDGGTHHASHAHAHARTQGQERERAYRTNVRCGSRRQRTDGATRRDGQLSIGRVQRQQALHLRTSHLLHRVHPPMSANATTPPPPASALAPPRHVSMGRGSDDACGTSCLAG